MNSSCCSHRLVSAGLCLLPRLASCPDGTFLLKRCRDQTWSPTSTGRAVQGCRPGPFPEGLGPGTALEEERSVLGRKNRWGPAAGACRQGSLGWRLVGLSLILPMYEMELIVAVGQSQCELAMAGGLVFTAPGGRARRGWGATMGKGWGPTGRGWACRVPQGIDVGLLPGGRACLRKAGLLEVAVPISHLGAFEALGAGSPVGDPVLLLGCPGQGFSAESHARAGFWTSGQNFCHMCHGTHLCEVLFLTFPLTRWRSQGSGREGWAAPGLCRTMSCSVLGTAPS